MPAATLDGSQPSTQPDPQGSSTIPTTVVLVVLCLVFLGTKLPHYLHPAHPSSPERFMDDFVVYMTAAQRIVHGEQIYIRVDDPRATTAPFTYPPFFALPFVLLLPFPEMVQRVLWFFICYGCLVGVLVMIWRCVGPVIGGAAVPAHRSVATPAWLFWAMVAAIVGRYVLSAFDTHDILVILLVALSIKAGCDSREAAAGLFAGLAAACKATPLLFAPVFVAQRRFVATLCMTVALVGATLLPDLATPSADRQSWVVHWYKTFLSDIGPGDAAQGKGGWMAWNQLNQSLPGTVYRLCAAPPPGQDGAVDVHLWLPSPDACRWMTMAARLGVLLLLGAAIWPGGRVEHIPPAFGALLRFGQGGAVICAMLLLSPMSSKAHFAALLLPVAFCAACWLRLRRDWLLGATLLAVFLIGTTTVKGLWGAAAGNRFLAYGTVCWSTTLILIGTVWAVRRLAALGKAPQAGEELCALSPPGSPPPA